MGHWSSLAMNSLCVFGLDILTYKTTHVVYLFIFWFSFLTTCIKRTKTKEQARSSHDSLLRIIFEPSENTHAPNASKIQLQQIHGAWTSWKTQTHSFIQQTVSLNWRTRIALYLYSIQCGAVWWLPETTIYCVCLPMVANFDCNPSKDVRPNVFWLKTKQFRMDY